jgi:hypothetical protein
MAVVRVPRTLPFDRNPHFRASRRRRRRLGAGLAQRVERGSRAKSAQLDAAGDMSMIRRLSAMLKV